MFVAYLDRTWIGKLPMTRNRARKDPLFKFTLWNKWMEVREDIPTTNNSNEGYNNQWNQSTEPNASLWTIITNFIREESLSRKTLLDSASGANSTENARKQKQRDKRTRIKNMTEMYNNIPAPDYMKQLAKIIGMD